MHKIKEEIKIEEIELKVFDLESMVDFYESVLGFRIFKEGKDEALLGSYKNPFLKLVRFDNLVRESPRNVGLYHVAYLLSSREKLAVTLRHLLEVEAPIEGFADHLVSEAIYLHDPEYNGIEIYRDRPREEWVKKNDKIMMTTEPLDIESLIALSENLEWKGIDDSARIGHVHLRVSNLSKTEDFYTKALGLTLTLRYYGAIFLSSGGYHHHIGANIWQSHGSRPRDEKMSGLSYFKIRLPSKEDMEGIIKNFEELKVKFNLEKELIVKDLDNITIHIV